MEKVSAHEKEAREAHKAETQRSHDENDSDPSEQNGDNAHAREHEAAEPSDELAEYLTVMADEGACLCWDALKMSEKASEAQERGQLEAAMRVSSTMTHLSLKLQSRNKVLRSEEKKALLTLLFFV